MRYKPYGEDRDTGRALVTDRKFTGQTIVDTYESISTPGTHYMVKKPDGYEFAGGENTRVLKVVNVGVKTLGLDEGIRAAVPFQNEVWPAGPAEYGIKEIWHECQHVFADQSSGDYTSSFSEWP